MSFSYGAAFGRLRNARTPVLQQFYPIVDGRPTNDSMAAVGRARAEFEKVKVEFDRITEEIRTGKRP